jgi:hypothetical protein
VCVQLSVPCVTMGVFAFNMLRLCAGEGSCSVGRGTGPGSDIIIDSEPESVLFGCRICSEATVESGASDVLE